MDIKYIEVRMWIKCMRLSWYGSTLDINTMEIFHFWRDCIWLSKFYNATDIVNNQRTI